MSDALAGLDLSSRNGGEMALRMLLFRHYDRISERLVSEGGGPWVHHAAKWAQNLVSHELEHDPDYDQELQEVQDRFKDANRPSEMNPKAWGVLKRLEEMEVITRHINMKGTFKAQHTPVDDEELL